MKNYAVVLASGTGSRLGSKTPKQFLMLKDKTILEHTVEVFEKSDKINEIIIVITPEYHEIANEILSKNNYSKVSKLLDGGAMRKDSSYIGINAITDLEANVLIHDCARPFISQDIINNCIQALEKYNAVAVAIPSADTIIEVDESNIIQAIPNRTRLRRIQTPQCFKLSIIKKAHELAKNDTNYTDDCGLILKYNLADIYVLNGDNDNIKITYPSDLYLAETIFEHR